MTSSFSSPDAQPLGVTAASNVLRRGLPSRVATSTSAAADTSSARVASACESRSTTRVETPLARAEEASPRTTEVLPTPPFRLHTLTTITPRTLPGRPRRRPADRPNGRCGPSPGRRATGPRERWLRRSGDIVPTLQTSHGRARAAPHAGASRAPKGQFSPEPLRRQDRAGEATLEVPSDGWVRQRGRRPAAHG